MTGRDAQAKEIEAALRNWRQGDVSLDSGLEFIHLADPTCPHTATSVEAVATAHGGATQAAENIVVAEEVKGVVVLTQTCDIVRPWEDRPFVEVAPLVGLDDETVEQVRRLKRPAFAYVPGMAEKGLVADLDRVMTVEKAIVASWTRVSGWRTDTESRMFSRALARQRSRFAFPDDFVLAADRFRRRMMEKHNRQTAEGSHLRALREIRIRGQPSWDHDMVYLMIWFIKERDPEDMNPDWPDLVDKWMGLFDDSGRFRVETAVACRLEDITACDYVESDLLDLDSLSVERNQG